MMVFLLLYFFFFFINKDPFVDKNFEGVISCVLSSGTNVACSVYKYI